MAGFLERTKEELIAEKDRLYAIYEQEKSKGLALDMSRGKPGPEQLDLSEGMLTCLSRSEDCVSFGMDTRNYGGLDGLPEAKEMFSELLCVREDELILGGNSSLNMMYDQVARAMMFGVLGGKPWSGQNVAFLCPSPGYDRHFSICERFGIRMIAVPMTKAGPDMDQVERLAAADESIKGIWCVPKYSNPDGITYSDDTVRRFAAMKPAAKDFRIFWDNAYCIHGLEDEEDALLDLLKECKKAGNPNRVYVFCSTSKISFPGGGVAAIAASAENVAEIKKELFFQTIGPDKVNQLRHVRFFQNVAGIRAHMRRHADILRPKFRVVLDTLARELGGLGIADWVSPRGGYFVSLNVLPGTAKRVFQLVKEAGVTMTAAGATFPYQNDPNDQNLRIAPTYPSVSELSQAMEVLCLCVKLAALEKRIG